MKKKRVASWGLFLYRGRMVWGVSGGLLLPHWLADLVCTAWNTVACAILGHDDFYLHAPEWLDSPNDKPVCTWCGRRLRHCTRHGTFHRKRQEG